MHFFVASSLVVYLIHYLIARLVWHALVVAGVPVVGVLVILAGLFTVSRLMRRRSRFARRAYR
jgi:surface polysaccharide O-acyltransferase-like enzyme